MHFTYAKLIFQCFIFCFISGFASPNIRTIASDKQQQQLAVSLHAERKRTGWNKTLLSIWPACSAALKKYCFFFSKSKGETHEQIAALVPNHLLISIRKVLGSANPASSAGKPRWMGFVCWEHWSVSRAYASGHSVKTA